MKWILALLLLAPQAWAYDLKVSWLPPQYNADSTDCMSDTLRSPLTDYRGTKIWIHYLGADTSFVGEFAPDVDSIVIGGVKDGVYGEVLARAVRNNGVETCYFAHALFSTPAVESITPPPQNGLGLRGEYYTYDRWNDFKVKLGERVDSTINFDWGAGSAWPGGSADWYSIRWTGVLTVPVPGSYTFYFDKNDGLRYNLDGVLLQDYWADGSGETQNTITLDAGPHPVRIEYYEGYSSAKCKWYWSGPGIPKQIVPKGALAP